MEAGVAHHHPRPRSTAGPAAPTARPPAQAEPSAPRRSAAAVAADYLALTKPRVLSLLLLTTVAAMFVADPSGPSAVLVVWTVLGGYLSAGGAGALNHYLDRDVDARMGRTKARPIVAGRIAPGHALAFALTLSVASTVVLALAVNGLAAVLALAGLLWYVFVYTLWLKRNTPQNIVIGGAAGAFPPLVGWAAATGSLPAEAWWLFAIVFVWTPPHFWALSLLISQDYARTGIPMMPVVRGERSTRRQILQYTLLLAAISIGPVVTGLFGWLYLGSAIALATAFVVLALRLSRDGGRPAARRLYLFSLTYLALLFVAMAVDRMLSTVI
ncbi:MAG: heme o synthase [Solirubrobacterales bacterium]